MEEIENIRRVEIRQGKDAFIDGEKMDEAGSGLAIFVCDCGFDGDVCFRARYVWCIQLDVQLAGGLVDFQR